ncbi:nSTAND1 domain-containing NTPase [Streptomyces sp. NBC_00576]|uniref:nSTAND1 domain-containing NTPase n=1 Tax=Streptomyces sp. NBC_00576 TaxID=2903665 RepID=UPI002E80B8CF|nr:SUMF1/EgtB/PvdO family nonheme iron enzyme [Streptomyces sp. NBC_00576]WUB74105.1 SUMF1/EgtB/PvdO family nonheme iron enzyme [Streptomyces sp. NBC_00576]
MPGHIGGHLRRVRLAGGLSQLELASRMGFPGQIVTEVERGEQAPTERYLEKYVAAVGLSPQQVVALWEEFRRTPSAAAGATVPGTGRDRGDCPYRGLYAFREQDAPLYHGRSSVVRRLARTIGHASLAGVVGASGSGKSSLVHAGLIPALRRQEHWAVAAFRPGSHPYTALAGALVELAHPEATVEQNAVAAASMAERMRNGGIGSFIEQIVRRLDRPLLVFADQFEELFTHSRDRQDIDQFLDHLADFAQEHPGGTSRAKVILTLRGDFYGRAIAHRRFSDVLQDHVVNLPPMNRVELRSAIVEPARARQLDLEDGLVDRILDDVGSEPGHLPLLEFALTLLWDRQSSGKLTHAAYEAVGEVVGAIATRAEEMYSTLSPQQQDTARQLLTRLVRVAPIGEEGEDARRRTPVAELTGLARVDEVIAALTDARLLVTDSDERAMPTVEVSHEAVIRNWGRLRTWLDGDRQFLLWQQRTRRRYEDWRAVPDDASTVLHGRLLTEAEGWLQSQGSDAVAGDLQEFIRHSADIHRAELHQQALAQVERLLTVKTDELMAVVTQLAIHRTVVDERVRQILRGEVALRAGADNGLAHEDIWRLQLFLAGADPVEAAWIGRNLRGIAPGELAVARQVLSPIDAELRGQLWGTLLDTEAVVPVARLHAAVLLAETATAPHDGRWSGVAQRLAADLLEQDQLHLPAWLAALGPVVEYLLEPLTATAVDTSVRETVRETAVSVLQEVAADRGDLLARLASGGPEHAYAEVVRRLAQSPIPAVHEAAQTELRSTLRLPPPPALTETERVELGRRRVAAACTLLRFSHTDGILERLVTAPDPEFATQFAHQASQREVPADTLAGLLAEAPDAQARYYLMMALGQYRPEAFSDTAQFDRTERLVLDLHHADPSAGVHSAARWLDRRWNHRIDGTETPAPYDPTGRRTWFTCAPPLGPRLTFSVFRPGNLLIGSPEDESERSSYEGPRRPTALTRSFALCDAQVTRGEFETFMAQAGRQGLPDISEWSDKPSEPVVAPTWYEAADFGTWLTTQIVPGSAPAEFGADLDDHPVTQPGWAGFRLPTEAEWEYACRAGTTTAYSFGSDRQLIDEYAWTGANSGLKTHEAGILRPNPAGLFDIHGQCWEWCSDWYALYDSAAESDPGGPEAGDRRVLRGGCWNLGARYARSACRNAHIPSNRNYYITFRLALTVPEPDPAWAGGLDPLPWSG